MKRRDFFIRLGQAAVVLPFAIPAITGCGGDDGGDGGGADASSGCASPNATIGENHGHTMTVAVADITAGVQKEYDIQGGSDHPHSVTLTASDFTRLQGGNSVMKDSTSGGGHTHTVTITCA